MYLNVPVLFIMLFIAAPMMPKASEEAVPFELNTSATGKLATETSEAIYTFTLSEAGKVKLSLQNNKDSEWHAEIYGKDVYPVYADVYTSTGTDGDKSQTEVGLAKGTYYIKIKSKHMGAENPYSMKLEYTKKKNVEIENNDTLAAAALLPLEQTFSGSISKVFDEDYYKVIIPKNGQLKLSVKTDVPQDWTVTIRDKNEKWRGEWDFSKVPQENGYQTNKIGLSEGTYYLSFQGEYARMPYELKTSFASTAEYYEEETNNSQTSATSMLLNKEYVGDLAYRLDRDYYKFTLPADGKVTFSFSQNANAKWKASILNANATIYSDDSKDRKKVASVPTGLAKGTYYILVEDPKGTALKTPYTLKVAFEPMTNYEKETHYNLISQNKIEINKLYKGTVGLRDSVDLFPFTVEKDANMTISLPVVPGTDWRAEIIDESYHVIKEVKSTKKNPLKQPVSFEAKLKKGNYYWKIYDNNEKDYYPYQFSISKKSPKPSTDQIKVLNNKGFKDSIAVSKLKKGDHIKIYNAESKGSLLASGTAKDTSLVLSVSQLGKTAGKIYASITKQGEAESDRTAIGFAGEKTDVLKTSQVKIVNNKKKNDTITVSGISKGDAVKVYTAASKGKLMASKTSAGSKTTLTVKQLGTKKGKVYVAIAYPGMVESDRIAVIYEGEKQ